MIRFVIVYLFVALASVAGQEQNDLINTNVERSFDLVSHIPKETISVTVENRGTQSVRSYDYYVEPQFVNNVAFFGAVVSKTITFDSFRTCIGHVAYQHMISSLSICLRSHMLLLTTLRFL
jgi:hypothetical protein